MFCKAVVDVNVTGGIVKSVGVCTFETQCLIERLKIAPGESDGDCSLLINSGRWTRAKTSAVRV